MNKFDPSKAQIGAFAYLNGREGLKNPSSLTRDSHINEGSQSVIKTGNQQYAPQEEAVKEATINGHQKEARSLPARSHVEQPDFSGVGDREGALNPRSTIHEVDTDLDPKGYDHSDRPSVKDVVRAGLKSLRAEVQGKEKDFLKERIEAQDARSEEFKSQPTDISIDRKGNFAENPQMLKSGQDIFSALTDEDLNPISLMLILDSRWEDEWYDWEIETINQTAKMESGVEIARVNQDKIMALKILNNTFLFFEDPRVFEKVCMSFSGRQVDWGHVQEPKTHEIAACIGLIERYIKEKPFSDEIAAYVAASAVRDGFVMLPSVLSFAEFPFSKQLAANIGDDIIGKQERLMNALDSEDSGMLEPEDAVQYMRIIKCQYHLQDKINEVRS